MISNCLDFLFRRSETIAKTLLYSLWVIVGVILFVILHQRSPFYINNQDPSYMYLSSFAALGSGNYTDFVDNPGFTMHIIGTTISRILYWFKQDGLSFHESIIIHSEFYLYAISVCMNVLTLAVLLCFAKIIKSALRSGWDVLLVVMFITLGSAFTLYRLTGVSSEVPLILVTTLGVGWVIHYTYSDLKEKNQYRNSLIAGLLIALTVGTKLTALPVICIYALILVSWKQRFLAIISAAVFWSTFWLMALPSVDYYIGFVKQIFLGGE